MSRLTATMTSPAARIVVLLSLPFLNLLFPSIAHAVPSMARQTGMQCAGCHTVFPELTPFGRQFKLRGFAMSTPKPDDAPFYDKIPVSGLFQVSNTATKNTGTDGATPDDFPKNKETIIQAAGIYYGGKITNKSGALVQYNYDGVENKWALEMADIRYADSATLGKELVYGFTMNNSPTLSDIYNSTPVWFSPHVDSVSVMPAAATVLDMSLSSQVGGVGAYGLWDNLVYGEVALYNTAATGFYRFMAANVAVDNVVRGTAPYWRLALQREEGPHSFEFGTYGMVTKLYADPEDHSLGTNKFTDIGLDAQYQYIEGDHTFSTQATWIHEKQQLNASFATGFASNASDTLRTVKIDAHYAYRRTYGGMLQYFATTGSSDDLKYNTGEPVMGSANGSPNSKGWLAQLDYLPIQNLKLSVRYTAYTQFNGAGTNYDGFGRNAKDNNSVFLLAWFLL